MFRIWGSGLRVCRGLGFRVQGLGWLGCLDFKDYRFRVYRAQALGLGSQWLFVITPITATHQLRVAGLGNGIHVNPNPQSSGLTPETL